VRRIFERFGQIYGAQKTAGMWGSVGMDRVVPVWAEALGQFDRATIAAAMRALPDRDSAWPPTLPEMLTLCREQITRPEHMRALPVPDRTVAEINAGREQMDRIASTVTAHPARDPLQWAYRIIERQKAGDQQLANISYRFALEAMRNTGREVPK